MPAAVVHITARATKHAVLCARPRARTLIHGNKCECACGIAVWLKMAVRYRCVCCRLRQRSGVHSLVKVYFRNELFAVTLHTARFLSSFHPKGLNEKFSCVMWEEESCVLCASQCLAERRQVLCKRGQRASWGDLGTEQGKSVVNSGLWLYCRNCVKWQDKTAVGNTCCDFGNFKI